MNRRTFFQQGGRLALLSGLLAGTGILVTRNGVKASCKDDARCSACGKAQACTLDKALKWRADEQPK